MTDSNDRINELHTKLELLLKRQEDFTREINDLRNEINRLVKPHEERSYQKDRLKEVEQSIQEDLSKKEVKKTQPINLSTPTNKIPNLKNDLEKFIGENLINKVGILITIIGVAIGAKYSFENDLISPLARIIVGYLVGLALIGFGIKLKNKYESYSAVLVSGAMAIMYFITFFAYQLYGLIPQIVAFVLMLFFTVFTVVAAINYNRQVIAHIGLVGAYAVPFLLGDGSGKVVVLFSYMVILNVGILVIAFKRYWKSLYYISFGLTWLIFFSWYVLKYQSSESYGLALFFSTVFFLIFYATFLAYKLLRKEKFGMNDIVLVIMNSFIFYGLGYGILTRRPIGEDLLGVFTLANAVLHFLVGVIVYKQKLADKNIFYLIAGMVLVFITITIPVQLEGNWITLLWASEAALLFWIGRSKNVLFYEKLSYPLMLLAFFSLLHDWENSYGIYGTNYSSERISTIFNVHFLSSMAFVGIFSFINVLNFKRYKTLRLEVQKVFSVLIPGILLFTVFYIFKMEIENYWNQLYTDSELIISLGDEEGTKHFWNSDLTKFKWIWLINYSLFYFSVLGFINIRKIKDQQLALMNIGFIVLVVLLFLTQGLYSLSELRDSYLNQSLADYYERGIINLWLRYISFSFVGLALYMAYKYSKEQFTQLKLKVAFAFFLHTVLLWIASSELINWMDIFKSEQSYKLGLSILWGVYSLFLIVYGIWKKNKTLRIGAIALFGITLVKLFFYDISHLNTIAKTIVFVSLGILLLIISFLYNKYKHLISEDESNN